MYSRFDYSRCGNLTREALLICLAKCEAGKYGIAFSSGYGAMSVVLHYIKTGDHVVCCDDVYGGTNRYMRKFAVAKFRMKIEFIDLTDLQKSKSLSLLRQNYFG